ncbi:hypothetical protein QBC46DRAFT_359140 [Diplogelasinospora grovesii]|uniref:Peptide hydrolase n=1 Tax=Diplogelasinospora grovesii TaxID=303347 RepID=A0AAN6RYY3_9PEZI|nr:hypothetical protein QBC46DRAFT_359140 [Diplogelasinospora grovesii]
MAGLKGFSLHALAALCGVSALGLQKPLSGSEQLPIADGASSPSSKKQLVDSDALQGTIRGDALLARAEELYEIAKLSEDEYNRPTRVIGSAGHSGTLKYIHYALTALGDYYTLSKQPFPAFSGTVRQHQLVLGDKVLFDAQPMGLTPPTRDNEPVNGDLVLVANEGCEASDYPSEVSGNIALILRGTCPFGTKSERAGRAGALAAVVYNYENESVSGTLGAPSPDHVATFGLSGGDAAPYVKKLKNGEKVEATAFMDAEVKTIRTNNIIAQTVQGDPDNCVMLGGHSDSVSEGPGVNDDGSGSLALLEIATQLTNFSVNNCVRFAWWSGEEEGLLGSNYYAENLPEEENMKIRLFMDYDMLASPNFAYQVYNATDDANPVGSEELRDLYIDWYTAHDLNYTLIEFDGRSDYDGFIRAGIPAGGIATGAEVKKTEEEEDMFGGRAGIPFDPCYHQSCDDVGNLNMTAWELNTKLVAHSVATFAKSFEGFPNRTDALDAKANKTKKGPYQGPKLIM